MLSLFIRTTVQTAVSKLENKLSFFFKQLKVSSNVTVVIDRKYIKVTLTVLKPRKFKKGVK